MDYVKINKEAWNKKVAFHLKSDFYDHDNFMSGTSSLNEIELEFLSHIKGKKILHLQCHFGQDSISLARLGAEVTAVDFSDEAIKAAQKINSELDLSVRFICSDVYELPSVLDEHFDYVFTSYGVLGWLPDMQRWGKVVSHFLKKGGKLLLVEFHPIVWMFDDDFSEIKYNYSTSKEIVEELEGTYADKDAPIKSKYVMWNHGLSEVLSSLLNNDLEIKTFKEYNYSPYNCFLAMNKIAERKFQLIKTGDKMPLVYSVLAEKKVN